MASNSACNTRVFIFFPRIEEADHGKINGY